jgi:hypothetical protein
MFHASFDERFQRATGISLDASRVALHAVSQLQAELSTTKDLLVRYFRVVEIATEGASVGNMIDKIAEDAILQRGWDVSSKDHPAVVIMSLMDLPNSEGGGARSGCRALSRIARYGAKSELVRLGAVASIIKAMDWTICRSDAIGAVVACEAISNILDSEESHRLAFPLVPTILTALILYMKKYRTNPVVSKAACKALATISKYRL